MSDVNPSMPWSLPFTHGDEAVETEAHDEHHRRRDLQAEGIVGVEPQHVA